MVSDQTRVALAQLEFGPTAKRIRELGTLFVVLGGLLSMNLLGFLGSLSLDRAQGVSGTQLILGALGIYSAYLGLGLRKLRPKVRQPSVILLWVITASAGLSWIPWVSKSTHPALVVLGSLSIGALFFLPVWIYCLGKLMSAKGRYVLSHDFSSLPVELTRTVATPSLPRPAMPVPPKGKWSGIASAAWLCFVGASMLIAACIFTLLAAFGKCFSGTARCRQI